jgi:alkylation response protein AidB-like acyl-CoA dehydrogenase
MPGILNPCSPASEASAGKKWLISDEALVRFHDRAPGYGRDNALFAEDFAELRDAGYLRAPPPAQFGSAGLPLSQVVREQRRLAYWAPATALAVNMHLHWAGAATSGYAQGQEDLGWLLRANVYFGIARRALDLAITTSRARTSQALKGQAHADKPAVQRQVARRRSPSTPRGP